MKTSDYALAMVLLAETDGSRYVAVFSSLPGHWQEVALGFDEFGLTDDTEDENGKLDPDQVAAIVFGDGIFLLAQLAKQLPFILAPDLGPRLMWLDDVSVDSETVPPRWEKTQIDGVPAVRLESFEGAPLQWLTLAGAGVEASYDKEHVADGDLSLRVVYNLPADKAFGLLTSPAGAPLAGMKRLRMSIVSKVPTVLLVELKEKDDSKYDTSVQLTGGDEFQPVNLALSGFKLADDSTDENGGLDIEQAKEFLIADISVLTQAPVTANTLWLDNIAFTE